MVVVSNGWEENLEEKAISEILVADTDSESGAEASDVEACFDDDDEEQKSNHRLQQVTDYQPGDHLKEGTQIFVLLSVQQKV